eukprot:GHVU01096738.1.p2 GENE.GHVU01096738.1~~GHVU01096738.1.p2  ORF type:complete len:115 (-),score=2.01 GHVU01096738.1:320-664(-)
MAIARPGRRDGNWDILHQEPALTTRLTSCTRRSPSHLRYRQPRAVSKERRVHAPVQPLRGQLPRHTETLDVGVPGLGTDDCVEATPDECGTIQRTDKKEYNSSRERDVISRVTA